MNPTSTNIQTDQPCLLEDWGLIDYLQAWRRQQALVAEVVAGDPERLIFCEHPTVLTLGRLGKDEHILADADQLCTRGIPLVRIDRGGEVTLHAPGQLVVYPIVRLDRFGRDLKLYLAMLEQVAIDLLRGFDILADSSEGRRGVWAGGRKIASIGIGVRKWVAYHGLAVNVNTDLALFSLIRPCGLNVQMTSMQELLGHAVDMVQVKKALVEVWERHFKVHRIL